MGQIDKFQQLNLVAAGFKETAADGIGDQGGGSFFDDAVFGQQAQFGSFDLVVQLMLAAGY